MTDKQYDVLIVGAGLFGCTVAHEALRDGKRVMIVDRRNHVGGNCWSYREDGIDVHAYGPHVIHTDHQEVWDYLTQFSQIEPCLADPIAKRGEKLYHLPFNMDTYYALWGATTPREAQGIIEQQVVHYEDPETLEQYALSRVGRDVYETLVKDYVEKQYGQSCSTLPASLLGRMPIRLTFDNDYLGHRYQGVPTDGYEKLFERMIEGAVVELEVDFFEHRSELNDIASSIVFTGGIDTFFEYRYGSLEYRGRSFEHRVFEEKSHQGIAVITYPDSHVPYLRSVEHKHFLKNPPDTDTTVVSYEYATRWTRGDDPYYTINDFANQARYERYASLAKNHPSVHFGGRLGEYRYYDMSDTLRSALASYEKWYRLTR